MPNPPAEPPPIPNRPVGPLQNRVTPTGEIVADSGRGLMMGNRGCLHTPDRRLGISRWRSKLWICCVLRWKNVHRDPMPPGRWTALFFVDEASALAAGHRPCAFCRWRDYLDFAHAWQRANDLAQRPRAAEMDAWLHRERVESRSRRQVTRTVRTAQLPDGVMVRHAGRVGLLLDRHVLPWSFTGYEAAEPLPRGSTVELLTPPISVAVIRAGYRPLVHPSAPASAHLRMLPPPESAVSADRGD